MNRIELLLHELVHTFEKEDWHPPLSHALAGLTAAQANWRPAGDAANTIWETVNHLLYYKERLLDHLKGTDKIYSASDNDATFSNPISNNDEDTWNSTVKRMEAVHRGLYGYLTTKSDQDFDLKMPNNPLGIMITSILMHDAYHTGQTIQIRKLQGSWPSNRSFN